MFNTSIKTNINNPQAKLFFNRKDEAMPPPSNPIPTPNLDLPISQQSVQSLHKISKHYKEFQQALY